MTCDDVGNLNRNAVLCPAATCATLVAHHHTFTVQTISHHQLNGYFGTIAFNKVFEGCIAKRGEFELVI
jgi:hypothetical protein